MLLLLVGCGDKAKDLHDTAQLKENRTTWPQGRRGNREQEIVELNFKDYRCGMNGLAELELFGDDPVTRNAERPELTGEVGNKIDLAAQHHCKIFQRRDISSDL